MNTVPENHTYAVEYFGPLETYWRMSVEAESADAAAREVAALTKCSPDDLMVTKTDEDTAQ